jgi:ferredoxin-type protein NapH
MIKNKYLILRRVTQIGLLFLYFGANAYGWNFLMGNLSSSLILGTIPMSDPFAVLQMFAAAALIASNLFIGAMIAFFSMQLLVVEHFVLGFVQ